MGKTRKTNGGPTRYAIYLRCSTDDQKEGDFTTIDTQRELNTRHAAQCGGTLVGEYADPGRTGTNLKRPGWERLRADALAGKFDAVCITYMSRLARGPVYAIAEYLLQEAGVRVEMVQEKFTDDMAGYVTKQMTMMMDGMYPQMVRQWTNTKMEEMVGKGYVTGNYSAYGYRKEFVAGAEVRSDKRAPQRLVIDPEAAPIVVRAFEIFVEARAIAPVLEYLNLVTERRWNYNTVPYLLRNEVYRGVLRFGDWVNEKAHEPIVSEALWNAARRVDNGAIRAPKQNPSDEFPYHLRGIIFCPSCGSQMTPFWSRGRSGPVRYYECVKHRKHKAACPVRRVNANGLHSAILGEIERIARHPTRLTGLIRDAVKAMPTPDSRAQEVTSLAKRLKDLDKRIGNVQEAIETGGGGALRTLVERLEALSVERVTVDQQFRDVAARVEAAKAERPDVAEVCRHLGNILKIYERATDEQKTIILQGLVGVVEMHSQSEGTCEILLDSQVPDFATDFNGPREDRFEICSEMGAGVGLEPTTFGL